MNIILDIDGCLADFILGFTTLANKMFNTPIIPTREHKAWGSFPGLTQEMESTVWEEIKSSNRFWYNLTPLVSPRVFSWIDSFSQRGHDVYFVTSRLGAYAKQQTEDWLMSQGVLDPTVIVSSKKGEIASAVGADYCLDDKAENAWCVAWMAPKTQACLLDRIYNHYDPNAFGSHRVKRVQTVEEFLDIVEGKNE